MDHQTANRRRDKPAKSEWNNGRQKREGRKTRAVKARKADSKKAGFTCRLTIQF